VASHADDLERVLDAVGVESAVFVGWSMGVQVVLELVARAPGRASHLVLMSGTYRRPFSSVALPGAHRWLSPLIGGAQKNSELVSRVVERLARSRNAANLVRGLRIVHPRFETDALLALAEEFRTIDFDVYFRTLRALNEHDGSHTLASTEDLVQRLPRAELYVVRDGTHYAPAEFPELVNARIDRFLGRKATEIDRLAPECKASPP
jgi:pimeloyl-ACP methyl ester carboxylesterase